MAHGPSQITDLATHVAKAWVVGVPSDLRMYIYIRDKLRDTTFHFTSQV